MRKEGIALGSLAARLWCAGDTAACEAATVESIGVLEQAGRSPELARAYAGASSLAMNLEKAEPAFAWSARAFELIDEDADRETFVYQLNNRGTMMLLLGRPEGRDELEHSIALAKKAGLEDHVGRGYIHIGWVASRLRDFALMERLSEGIEYCTEHGLELWRLYLIAYRARAQLDQGDWTEAAESALFVLNQPQQAPLLRLLTLTVLGTIRARRGDPDASSPLEEALELSAGKADLQHLAPVAIARTEAAALEGNLQVAEEASSAVLEIAVERGAVWVAGELAYWRRRGGIVESMPDGIPEPFARALSEDWADAARRWRELGCPYEAALALADADDAESIRRALDELRALGAGRAAALATRRLRERGDVLHQRAELLAREQHPVRSRLLMNAPKRHVAPAQVEVRGQRSHPA